MRIPRASADDERTAPAWLPMQDAAGQPLKPVIRCACGRLASIAYHHVHADGRVTESFLERSCGFHEWLELADWTGQDFPPEDRHGS